MNTGISEIVLNEINESAIRNGLDHVILFGSRARGDFKSRSDIDLAVSGGNTALFYADMDDTSTLMSFDVVDLDKPVQEELMASICREGITLYEKGR